MKVCNNSPYFKSSDDLKKFVVSVLVDDVVDESDDTDDTEVETDNDNENEEEENENKKVPDQLFYKLN